MTRIGGRIIDIKINKRKRINIFIDVLYIPRRGRWKEGKEKKLAFWSPFFFSFLRL
jgi:hypothetical protein